ncbi:MAG TPA: hypothetical protein VGG39_16830 [Polyangiaceae bacterium]|jgi:hypothetical protein
MRLAPALAFAAPLLAVALLTVGCGGKTNHGSPSDGGVTAEGGGGPPGVDGGPGAEGGTGSEGGAGNEGGPASEAGPIPTASANKVDLLFMLDNSASMGDKQVLLAAAVPDVLQGLVSLQVHDMHVGIVTSSLGGRGGDQCNPSATNPASPSLNAHNDDRGELIDRSGVAGDPTVETVPAAGENASHFLGWFPSDAANSGATPPPAPVVTDEATLVGDFTGMVEGVHEHGCGFEAQNEAWYRFLVQPDPFDTITKNGTQAAFTGVDATILQQRHDFLRPDSLLIVVVLTDESEAVADPLSISGQGWAFENEQFPGSTNGSAPEGSIECKNLDPNNPLTTGPNDPNCTSCAFLQGAPNFATECPNDGTNGTNGYLDPIDDQLNVRFFHQKERFGLLAGYPTSRYVRGLSKTTVPDSQHEHDGNGNYIGDQDAQANCTNPIFAASLPANGTGELCNLPPGPRTSGLVLYEAIAGVPHQLLQQDPTNPDSPQKTALTDADWKLILGTDPENYDFRGADFHMIEDWNPRTTQGVYANASQCPPGSPNDCDPINGRECATNEGDLQFACIFDIRSLYGGVGKDCTQAKFLGACDCASGALGSTTPLCDTTTPTLQIYAKAYPSVREMIIAHALGEQGLVSSLCPIHVTDTGGGDPLYGYRPAVLSLLARAGKSLTQ